MPLLPKPDLCQGCPAYGDGKGYVPDLIRHNAPIAVVAQEPGEDEEAGRRYLGHDTYEEAPHQPLIGRTGRMMDQTFLGLAGLNREDVSLGNTIRCRINHSNDFPIKKKNVQEIVRFCTNAHRHLRPEGVKLYVAMGEGATYGLTKILYDFNGWRGYLLPYSPHGTPYTPHTDVWTPGPGEIPVLVTHHLAYLFREPEASLPAKRDWNKVQSILDRTWPIPMSQIEDTQPDIWPRYSAFDTEFTTDKRRQLIRYSLATRDRRVWVVEAADMVGVTVQPKSTVIMHNAPADLGYLRRILDLSSADITIEDTMYAHAVLWTGKVESEATKGKVGGAMSHALNFLGSMYARINRWKHLSDLAPRLYSGGDAIGTMDVWDTGLYGGIKGELARDPKSAWVYENLQKPLIPIIMRAMATGIATNPEAVKVALQDITMTQTGYVHQAQAYAGWPINLRSPKQLAYWLYTVEGLKARNRSRG